MELPTITPSGGSSYKEGTSVTLSCSSVANPAVTYTWLKGGTVIKDENKSTWTTASVKRADAGEYVCKVANSANNSPLSSAKFTLKVLCECLVFNSSTVVYNKYHCFGPHVWMFQYMDLFFYLLLVFRCTPNSSFQCAIFFIFGYKFNNGLYADIGIYYSRY